MTINWIQIGNDPDDLKADVGDGEMLRVEKMDDNYYWWCVYFNDVDFHSYDDAGITLEDAKEKCTLKYFSLKYPVT